MYAYVMLVNLSVCPPVRTFMTQFTNAVGIYGVSSVVDRSYVYVHC